VPAVEAHAKRAVLQEAVHSGEGGTKPAGVVVKLRGWRDRRMTERAGVDGNFTKIAVGLLTNVRDLVDWGVEGGHTTEERLRLTVSARQVRAKELVDYGLSQRKAAKILGVDEGTIRNDLRNVSADDAETFRAEKAEFVRQKNATLAEAAVEAPRDRFETIVLDPPWPITKIERDVRPNQVEFDYPTMTEAELRGFAVTIEAMARDDCHMFMWTTQKFLPFAMELIELYGFRYVLTMVWHKPARK
jgi:hypothetical protein